MALTYVNIATQTLGSSATSVTFSSIPQTYTDLVVRVSTRTDRGANPDQIQINFNGDTATNYSRTTLTGGNTTVTSVRLASATSWDFAITNGNTTTANTFNNAEFYIPNYTSTSSRAGSFFGVQEDNAANTAFIRTNAYLYRGSSAISSIVLTPVSGPNFLTGSSFYLYGIKNS